jgi:hypothetical protein
LTDGSSSLINEVPTGQVEGPVDREPGLVVALPEVDPDVDLSELGPSFIIGQRVQAHLFPQEAGVESMHLLHHRYCMVLLEQELIDLLLRRFPRCRERIERGDD